MLITCPLCGHVHTDDLEVLAVGDTGPMKCESCAQQFELSVWECPACEDHMASTSAVGTPMVMKCSACGADRAEHQSDALQGELDAADTGC